jgi:hypothetical protein
MPAMLELIATPEDFSAGSAQQVHRSAPVGKCAKEKSRLDAGLRCW